jgi:Holliday junction resolvasome RuvABC endonuclease subunit
MQRIAGIDFSLTKTGIAIATQRVDGSVIMNTSTVTSTGHNGDTLAERSARLDDHIAAVYDATLTCSLIILESLSFGNRSSDEGRLWAGWWMLVCRYRRADIPVATISPASLKLAIAGKAAVDKSVLGRCLVKLWPDLEYANDNEADAGGLAHLGAVRCGWGVPTLQRHQDVKGEWPEFGLTTNVEEAS